MRPVRRLLCAATLVAIAATTLVASEAAAGGGGCYPEPMRRASAARLQGPRAGAAVEACAFSPTVLYVDEGAEVTWVNKDPFPHTVTGAYVGWGSERYLSQGETLTEEFDKAGVYPYYCLLHPGMVGAVVVGDPDPSKVTERLASFTGTDEGGGPDQTASRADNRAAADAQPASDWASTSLLLGSLVLLIVAAAVVTFLRRRANLEHGV